MILDIISKLKVKSFIYQQIKEYLGGKLFVDTSGTGVGLLEVSTFLTDRHIQVLSWVRLSNHNSSVASKKPNN